MHMTRIFGAIALSAILCAPHPAAADGGASTRNIILGGAAIGGTLLILNHNKKVHERYAEDSRRQAALEAQRSDAWAAYEAEKAAYEHQTAVNADLEKEVSFQHKVVSQLRHELAASRPKPTRVASKAAPDTVSYGWGQP
jgi:hypothetical protein